MIYSCPAHDWFIKTVHEFYSFVSIVYIKNRVWYTIDYNDNITKKIDRTHIETHCPVPPPPQHTLRMLSIVPGVDYLIYTASGINFRYNTFVYVYFFHFESAFYLQSRIKHKNLRYLAFFIEMEKKYKSFNTYASSESGHIYVVVHVHLKLKWKQFYKEFNVLVHLYRVIKETSDVVEKLTKH